MMLLCMFIVECKEMDHFAHDCFVYQTHAIEGVWTHTIEIATAEQHGGRRHVIYLTLHHFCVSIHVVVSPRNRKWIVADGSPHP